MCTTKEYKDLFRKYQKGKASVREMHELLTGLKEDGMFCHWMDETWEAADTKMSDDLSNRLYVQIKQRIEDEKELGRMSSHIRVLWSSIRKVAAVLLIFIGIGLCYWQISSSKVSWRTISSNDKFLQVTLPDSTHVWLSRYTTVKYPERFTGADRIIKLAGQAYFEVKHDRSHPFIVNSKRICIQVTGTKFSVSDFSKRDICKVVLSEGSVNVSRQPSGSYRATHLRPNDEYILMHNGTEIIRTVDAQNLVAWKNGYYHFSNEPLGDVLKNLADFYGKNITCSASIRRRKVTGTVFLNDEFRVALTDLSYVVPIQWSMAKGECSVVLKK